MKQLPILLLGLTSFIIVETASVNRITDRNNLFGVDVFQGLYKEGIQNLLVSPFASYTGLSLLRSGAKEASAEQLRKVLYGSFDLKRDESAFQLLLTDMENRNIRTDVYSGIFVDKLYEIRDEYKNVASNVFNASASKLDLFDKHGAVRSINEWIRKESNSTINEIITPNDITEDTRVVLLNGLYFNGTWHNNFNPSDTVDQIFFVPGGNNVKIPTMVQRGVYGYAENKKLKVKFLELPFISLEGIPENETCIHDQSSLVIVLPDEIDGVDGLKHNINEALRPQNFVQTPVNLYLPRFQDNSTIDFKPILDTLGVNRIFSPTTADLSGIAGKPGDIYLNKYHQWVSIGLNEDGLKAAGTTHLTIETTPPRLGPDSGALPEPVIDFRVNHPFLYYLKAYGLITFVGKFYDPSIVGPIINPPTV